MFELWYEDDLGEHYYDTYDTEEEARDGAELLRDEYGNIHVTIMRV